MVRSLVRARLCVFMCIHNLLYIYTIYMFFCTLSTLLYTVLAWISWMNLVQPATNCTTVFSEESSVVRKYHTVADVFLQHQQTIIDRQLALIISIYMFCIWVLGFFKFVADSEETGTKSWKNCTFLFFHPKKKFSSI